MTTGSKVHGYSYAVGTGSGMGTVYNDSGTLSWTGTDYPKAPRVYNKVENSYYKRKIIVRDGKRMVTYQHVSRFRNVFVRPPKRVRTEEHPYVKTDSSRYDNVFWYKNPTWPSGNTGTGGNTGLANFQMKQRWTNNDDIALLGKLREAVAGSDFNLGVFLGEGNQALSMIANAANRVGAAMFAMKRGRPIHAAWILTRGTDRERKRHLTSANNWLELQYGWLPLLADAHDGAIFLAHHLEYPLQKVIRVSHFSGAELDLSINASVCRPIKTSGFTRKSIKAIIAEKDVAQLSGLTDPLSVAWELVPYSFVIDWFIPIGNYLAARGLSSSLSGKFVTSTIVKSEWKGTKSIQPTVTVYNGNEGPGFKSLSFTRTVDTTLQVPRPQVKPLAQMLSWKRAANALALLAQTKR